MNEHITASELMSLIQQHGRIKEREAEFLATDRPVLGLRARDEANALYFAIEAQVKRVYQCLDVKPSYPQARGIFQSDEPSEVTMRKLRGYEEDEQ